MVGLLLALAASPDREQALKLSGLDEGEFDSAVSYLRGAKLVRAQRQEKKRAEQKPEKENKTDETKAEFDINDPSLPEYTSDEIKRISEGDRIFNSILDEAQQTFGKVFNSVEMNYVVAMRDHLGLDGEYILMLLQYFRREGKPLCYVVRVADSLVKQGVADPEALEQYIKRRDAFKGSEGKYRDLFGIGTRSLTAYEEKYFQSWSEDMKMPFELVKLAFDRTVEKKGTPQKSYINGILKSWKEKSLASEADVLQYEKSKTAPKSDTARLESSFNIDEFFNAALERTYGKEE